MYGFSDKEYRIPSELILTETLKLVDYKNIIINEEHSTVLLAEKQMRIKLSGIIKGYSLDKITDFLQSSSVEYYKIDFGGNLALSLPDSIPVGIESHENSIQNTIMMKQGFISTSSGSHQSFIKGEQLYTHIVNPTTGSAKPCVLSATVKTWSGIESDFLSTYFFLAGSNPSPLIIKKYLPQASVYIYDLDGHFSTYAENYNP